MIRDIVIFTRNGGPNDLRNKKQVEGKKASSIIEELQLKGEKLAIVTSNFIEPLGDDSIPLDMYPQIVLDRRPEKYERPIPYIMIIPDSDVSTLTIFVNVESQEGTDFPYLSAKIDLIDVKEKGITSLIKQVDQTMTTPHSLLGIFAENQLITYADDPMVIIEKAKENRLVLKCTVPDSEVKKMIYRTKIIEEILKTEETYINGLNRLSTFWQPNMISAKLLTMEEATSIFQNFAVISACHQRFLNQLKAKGGSFSSQVAEALLNSTEFFKASSYYIGSYNTCLSLIKRKLSNPVSQRLMDEIMQKNPDDKLEILSSLLITPIQRMPRYILFIKELIKKTPSCHPDFVMLETAHCIIEKVTREIEVLASRAEMNQKLLDFEERLLKPFSIYYEGRTIEDTIDVVLTKPMMSQGKVYVFNDIIVITQIEKKGELVVFCCKTGSFVFGPSSINSESITVISTSEPDKSATITFPDPEKMKYVTKKIEDKFSLCEENKGIYLNMKLHQTRFMNDNRKSHSSIESNGKIYTFGGLVDNTPSSSFTIFNNILMTTNSIECPIEPRYDCSISTRENCLYIFGGRNNEEFFSDLWEYNVLTSEWKKISPFLDTTPRSGHSSVIYNDRMIVFGGCRKKDYLSSVSVFNFSHQNWHTAVFDGSPPPRAFHTANLVNTSMIVVGGTNSGVVFDDIWIFDVEKIYWRQVQYSIPGNPPRYGHCSFIISQYLFLIGGTNDSNTVSSCMINTYDKTYQEIKINGIFPPNLCSFSLCLTEKFDVFIIGGSDSQGLIVYPTVLSLSIAGEYPCSPNKEMVSPELLPRSGKRKFRVPSVVPNSGQLEILVSEITKVKDNLEKSVPKKSRSQEEVIKHEKQIVFEMNASEEEVCGMLSIDPSKLIPFQKQVFSRKLKKLIEMNRTNQSLKDEFNNTQSGDSDNVVQEFPVFFKIFINNAPLVIKSTSTCTIDELLSQLNQRGEKYCKVFCKTTKEEITQEILNERIRSLLTCKRKCVDLSVF